MADMLDYLELRGDVSFDDEPFNEVDNLVLAELSYTVFDGIVGEGPEEVPLEEADEAFFAAHPRSEVRQESNHILRAPLLMDAMLSGRRFRGCRLTRYVDVINAGKDMQMAAVTVLLEDGSAYVSFRGTDDSVAGWKEDFNMSYLPDTAGQQSALRYLDRIAEETDRPLRVGGHSKGGNFAVYASAFCDEKVQDRIMAVYTNDGPGFRKEVMSREGFPRIMPKVVSIVPDTSVVGMLLASGAEHMIVKSSGMGIAQHDPLTWQIDESRFVTAEQSALGHFIHGSQKDWLSRIDDKSREMFVNTLFSVIGATGVDTFGEMAENKLKSAERMLAEIRGMSAARRKEFLSIVAELLHAAGRRL